MPTEEEFVARDKDGWVSCGRCGATELQICQPPGEYQTYASCPKCKVSESIHSG